MLDLKKLNKHALKRFEDYSSLNIYGHKVAAPYFRNFIGLYFDRLQKKAGISNSKIMKTRELYAKKVIPFGWERGKGKPEELEKAVKGISERVGISLKNSTQSGIRHFMHLFGIGIDCSGFVYEVLRYVFEKIGKEDMFIQSLNWKDSSKQRASWANTRVFLDKASSLIEPQDVKEFDLVFRKSAKGRYNHIGLILKKGRDLFLIQSAVTVSSSNGVIGNKIKLVNKLVRFDFKPVLGQAWEKLYEQGRIEFRRLKVIKGKSE